jgi:hypothetical protein
MPIVGLLPWGGLLSFAELCCHEGEQFCHRAEPGCLTRDEVLDTPRDASGVQRRLGSELHHKGVLDREGTL